MPVYSHEAMDKISGFQQGLEASMTRHKEELSQRFGARIAHACREAEDAAFERARALFEPQLRALGERLEAHVAEARARAEKAAGDVAGLAARHADAAEELAALKTRAGETADRAEDLREKLGEESRTRAAACEALEARLFELQGDLVREGQAREEADDKLVERVRGASAEAATSAVHRAVEHADSRFTEASAATAALEERMLQRLVEEFDRCLREAGQATEDAASRLREEMGVAAQRAKRQADDAREHAEGLVKASAAALRGEQAEASERLIGAAEQAGREKADEVSTHLHLKLEQAGREAEKASRESVAPLWEALATLEGRVADARHTCASELRNLVNGETVRHQLLDALQAQGGASRALVPAGGAQGRIADSALLQSNPHVRRTLEVGLQEDVLGLRASLADVDRRLCQERDRLDEELRGRATSHEVYTRLQASVADLSSRCSSAQSEACEARVRSQQEMLALASEVTALRAATASLAGGVVKALQVLGLLEAAAPSAGPLTPRPAREEAGRAAAVAGGAAGAWAGGGRQSDLKGSCVRLEDILNWEKSGNSLATKVARLWKPREAAGLPSVVAALDRLLGAAAPTALEVAPESARPALAPLVAIAPPALQPLAPGKPLPQGVASARGMGGSARMWG